MPTSPSELYRQQVRFAPAYTVTEAARILGVSRSTLDYWVRGRLVKYGDDLYRTRDPLIDVARPSKPCRLSFVNLLEADVIRVITKDRSIKLEAVRTLLDALKKEYAHDHPLVLHEFGTAGQRLLVRDESVGEYIDHNGQMELRQTLDMYFERVEYDQDLAKAYFIDEARTVKVDPLIAFGHPVLAGTGYRTDMIAQRHWAGDSIDTLIEDYALEEARIKQAIEWEEAQRSLRTAA